MDNLTEQELNQTDYLTAKQRFDQSVQHEIRRLIKEAEKGYESKFRDEYSLSMTESLCQWYDDREKRGLPVSFEEWIQQNGDAIL